MNFQHIHVSVLNGLKLRTTCSFAWMGILTQTHIWLTKRLWSLIQANNRPVVTSCINRCPVPGSLFKYLWMFLVLLCYDRILWVIRLSGSKKCLERQQHRPQSHGSRPMMYKTLHLVNNSHTLFHEFFRTFSADIIGLPGHRNKRESVLEITKKLKMHYF